MKPIGCENTSASVPSGRFSLGSGSPFVPTGCTSFFFDLVKRLRKETPFLHELSVLLINPSRGYCRPPSSSHSEMVQFSRIRESLLFVF